MKLCLNYLENCLYSSFNTAYIDADLADYKMILSQFSKYSLLGNDFKSVIFKLTF